jgi:hypothetical protein
MLEGLGKFGGNLWLFGQPVLREASTNGGEFELFGVMLVEEGLEVGAAASFVEACSAYDNELLALAEALGVDGRLAADHADGGEFCDLVGDGHEGGDGAEGLGVEGSIEARHYYAFA